MSDSTYDEIWGHQTNLALARALFTIVELWGGGKEFEYQLEYQFKLGSAGEDFLNYCISRNLLKGYRIDDKKDELGLDIYYIRLTDEMNEYIALFLI